MFVSLVVTPPPTLVGADIKRARTRRVVWQYALGRGKRRPAGGQTAIPLVGLLRRPVQPGPGSRRLLVALRLVLLMRLGLCLTPGRRV